MTHTLKNITGRKVYLDDQDENHLAYIVTSPATGQSIVFDDRWNFNGDFEKPTFTPSMLLEYPEEHPELGLVREHFFVTDGKIQYLNDCNHEMAGQTVDMIDCTWYETNEDL